MRIAFYPQKKIIIFSMKDILIFRNDFVSLLKISVILYVFKNIYLKEMNFKTKLSKRVGMTVIHEITFLTQDSNQRKRELYNLLFDKDDLVAYQAAWTLTHFTVTDNEWLFDKQNELIDEVLVCQHPGKRRLILSVILRQPLNNPPRMDFLDFCLERMMSKKELPAVQTLSMKLAYEMCRNFPELKQEFSVLLDMMEPDLLEISMRTARKNVLNAMKKEKSLQTY